MGGTSIDDQENRACGTGDEALEKFNEDSGIDTALLLDHEPHLASRGDRRDQAHAMACAGGFDDRRFALLAPTPPRVMIRAHVGGIAKEDLRFFPLCKGFWQVMPSCASNRPTELALNEMPNLSRISLATMSRVHSANANFSCNGFFSVTVLYTHCMARAFSLGGLPNNGWAFNAPHPPRLYRADHPYIVRRLILKDRATTSGFSPACTLRTARIRIASSVA